MVILSILTLLALIGGLYFLARRQSSRVLLPVFGILLPAVTVSVEYFTHFCAQIFFDPIPTNWHLLWVSLVPAANLIVWGGMRDSSTQQVLPFGIINGIAIGVAGLYSLFFLPLLPLAIFALPFFGIGLLPLTPLCSFLSAQTLRRRIRTLALPEGEHMVPGVRLGIGLSLLALFLLDGPAALTRLAIVAAASSSPNTSHQGIHWLRILGGEALLLRDCHARPVLARDFSTLFFAITRSLGREEVCTLYFRVTGRPANAEALPVTARSRPDQSPPTEGDLNQGGNRVGGKVNGLSLTYSRMTGTLDSDAVLAEIEWTLVFSNASSQPREARAQINLPPGGVVSRLTLWIDGREHEAAFGERGQVRQAYEQVVQRQRDPVLVTMNGPDRVFVQCFPVLPQNGTMKIRIGITTPLILDTREAGVLVLPTLLETNFLVAEKFAHEIHFESLHPLWTETKSLISQPANTGRFPLRGAVLQSILETEPVTITATRSPALMQVWATDVTNSGVSIVRQTITEEPSPAPKRVVMVIDGSQEVRDSLAAIAEAFLAIPEPIELTVLVASDGVMNLSTGVRSSSREGALIIADRIRTLTNEGGHENVSALIQADKVATERLGSIIVWIHGPQPVVFPQQAIFLQQRRRTADPPYLYTIAVRPGPNRLLEQFEDGKGVTVVPRRGPFKQDLLRLFVSWQHGATRFSTHREKVEHESAPKPDCGAETSLALVRLWAWDKVLQLLRTEGNLGHDQAIALATNYRIVTPVSAAVVLETMEQYQVAGLTPGPPGNLSAVPEPGTFLLVITGVAVLTWFYRSHAPCAQ
jgi:hypothetical protein